MLLDLGHSELVVLPDNYRHIKFLALRWCPEGTAGRGEGDKHYILPAPPPILEKSGLKAFARETRLQRGFGSASRTISGALVLGDPRLRPLPDGRQTAVYPSSLLDALRALPPCIRCSEAVGQVHRHKDSGALVRPLGYHANSHDLCALEQVT